jgi:hypothetical protein
MSKIEVDAIDKQSGSTLTLGGSGTAVTLACGATQTGFGRTGTVDWQTSSIKTANFTAVNGEGYFCDTSSGAFEVDLPAGSAGAIVAFKDYAGTWDTANLTVDPNGSEKIGGGPAGETAALSTENSSVTLVYVDSTKGWLVINDATQGVAGETAQFVAASGGTETTVCTNFKVHTFTGPGTFSVSNAGNSKGSNSMDYLVIAGGGGSGGSSSGSIWGGGGGGAGGYRESSGTASGSYTISPLGACVAAVSASVTSFPITVGAGGSGSSATTPSTPGSTVASNGSTSTGLNVSSAGGGYGGTRSVSPIPASDQQTQSGGQPGGSGGGAGFSNCYGFLGGVGNTPSVSPAQGTDGGKTSPANQGSPTCVPGGGGGATVAGGTGPAPGNSPGSAPAGTGGAGATSSINGTPTARAGGGGAGGAAPNQPGAPGGAGGGGAGANQTDAAGQPGNAGTANTGGGAGSASGRAGGNPGGNGAAGGSGVVIIRYKFQ